MLTVPHAAVPPAQWQNVVRLAPTNWNMFVQIARVFKDCGSPAIASLCASANFVPGLYLVTVSLQLLDRIMDNNQAADVSPVTQTPLGNTHTENGRQNAKKQTALKDIFPVLQAILSHTQIDIDCYWLNCDGNTHWYCHRQNARSELFVNMYMSYCTVRNSRMCKVKHEGRLN